MFLKDLLLLNSLNQNQALLHYLNWVKGNDIRSDVRDWIKMMLQGEFYFKYTWNIDHECEWIDLFHIWIFSSLFLLTITIMSPWNSTVQFDLNGTHVASFIGNKSWIFGDSWVCVYRHMYICLFETFFFAKIRNKNECQD